MIAVCKQNLETIGLPNVLTYSSSKIKSLTIATGSDFKAQISHLASSIKSPFDKVLLSYYDRLVICKITSPLVLNINTNPSLILLNIRPLNISSITRLNITTVSAVILAGSAFLKNIVFNESVVVDFLYSLLIRVFGKKYGLLVSEKSQKLRSIIESYALSWRKGYNVPFDAFISTLNNVIPVSKSSFLAHLMAFCGIEGIPVIEDYYRMFSYIVGCLIPNNVFRKRMLMVNKSVSKQIIYLWTNARPKE